MCFIKHAYNGVRGINLETLFSVVISLQHIPTICYIPQSSPVLPTPEMTAGESTGERLDRAAAARAAAAADQEDHQLNGGYTALMGGGGGGVSLFLLL